MRLSKLLTSQIPRVAGFVGRIPWLRRVISRRVINEACNATSPRPRPFSMASDYTTWRGLTDRRFTGRHLPAAAPERLEGLPSEAEVTALFRREKEIKSTDTSVMFAFFAQWFTDSFLRTSHEEGKFGQNTSNHEIDLCQIYGLSEEKTTMLRAHEGGRLSSQLIGGEEFPPFLFEPRQPGGPLVFKSKFKGLHHEQFLTEVILGDMPDERKDSVFAVGLEHGNSTIGNTIMNVLFLREHNRVAGVLQQANPDWDDERLFQTARNVMIVILLNLVVQQYIMHIAPFDFPLENVAFLAEGARWNRSNWIAIEFNLLYRWHSLVPDAIGQGDNRLEPHDFRNNNPLVISRGIEELISQLSNEKSGRIGLLNTPQFLVDRHDHTPDQPSVEERTVGLMRKARLASYNDYRRAFKLRPLRSFEELTGDIVVRERLQRLYGDIDRLEWYVGIFAEDYGEEMMMGGLLTAMVAYDAFTQALTNPLLARNVYTENTFSPDGLKVIETTKTLQQIVARNSNPDKHVHTSFKV
ncbi:MAG: hypothetical protein M3N28_07600 [Actinomycetota bacterium]|nr:hypothetical protein [Actinomycetota bacterium]